MGIPLLLFELLSWDQVCWLLILHFCYLLGAMDDLFSFDNVVNAIQGGKPQKKRSKRQLVKVLGAANQPMRIAELLILR